MGDRVPVRCAHGPTLARAADRHEGPGRQRPQEICRPGTSTARNHGGSGPSSRVRQSLSRPSRSLASVWEINRETCICEMPRSRRCPTGSCCRRTGGSDAPFPGRARRAGAPATGSPPPPPVRRPPRRGWRPGSGCRRRRTAARPASCCGRRWRRRGPRGPPRAGCPGAGPARWAWAPGRSSAPARPRGVQRPVQLLQPAGHAHRPALVAEVPLDLTGDVGTANEGNSTPRVSRTGRWRRSGPACRPAAGRRRARRGC